MRSILQRASRFFWRSVIGNFSALTALIVWMTPAVAQVASESFSYPDGALHEASQGRWFIQTASSTATPNDGALSVANGSVLINQADLTTGRERVSLGFDPPFSSTNNTVAYFACDATWLALPITPTGSYFMHLSVSTNETATFYARLGANLNGATPGFFHVTVANANWTVANAVAAPLDLVLNTTYRLVVRYDLSTQNTSLWVDPIDERDPSVTASDPATGTQRQIAAISLRQGLSNSSSGAPGQVRLDNLVVGRSFAEVVATEAPHIRLQPTNAVVTEGDLATFFLTTAGPGGVRFSWTRNGLPVPGGTNASLKFGPIGAADDGALFAVKLVNRFGAITSDIVRLTVLPDRTPPQVISAANEGLFQINLQFSENVDPLVATTLSNYLISPRVEILSIRMIDPKNAQLTVSSLKIGIEYTLTLSGIQDLASHPNSIAPGTQISLVAASLRSESLGGIVGHSTPSEHGTDISSSGGEIGGAADHCQFSYRLQTGDFDVRTRVASMSQSGTFAKAALMARASLDANSATAAVIATPNMAGCLFQFRNNPDEVASEVGSFPVNFPQMWLRLQRIGTQVNGFASYDGVSWNLLGSGSLASPSVHLGLAVSSGEGEAVASFRDFGEVVNPTAVLILPPHEPMGPSSRRTQLVFSEIMYTPAARPDGKNLEFVEIYNSNPWWDDISGYRLEGLISYTFPSNSKIPGGGYLVVAAAPDTLRAVYGISNVVGPYSGNLKKFGQLKLLSNLGAVLLDTTYEDVLPWPAGAHGTGHSIVLANPSYGEADPRAWSLSDSVGGSPGGLDPVTPSPLRTVVINEFLAHHDASHLTYIELYNHSTAAVDVSGCHLTRGTTNLFTIPGGSVISPSGFLSFTGDQLGFEPDPMGGRLQFWNPNASRVIDAVTYEAQGINIPWGRWPDGALDFYPLEQPTPALHNARPRISQVVINELMYKPISGQDADQYVELFNRGLTVVDLSNWSFAAGLTFQFPPGTLLSPGNYLVVAKNHAQLFSHYPQLNSANTIGDFSGKIPHSGGRVALARPEAFSGQDAHGKPSTILLPVVEDEVIYSKGGRWGKWAHGGGSSLELVNPNTNHRLAYNWADSDESGKSSWTNLVVTGVLDNGANFGTFVDQVQLGLLDVGEALVDNISVGLGSNGPNLIKNGDFEAGLTNWALLGDHVRSSLETPLGLGGFQSPNSVHLRASDGVWVAANSVQGILLSGGLTAGRTATMSLAGRWLHGSPEVLLRLHGNWLELTGALPIPENLGTPGLPNSRRVPDPAPAIFAVSHSPAIPPARKPVVVTSRFDGIGNGSPTLLYRIDSKIDLHPSYRTLPMVDDGTGGDLVPQDGLYSATIPGQAAGVVVAFVIKATSPTGSLSEFPMPRSDNTGLPYECLVVFGDATPGGTFGHYHLWMTQNWIDRWASGGGLSNEGNDGTFVDGGGRIIYNIEGRFAGSPYHQYLGSPVTTLGGQHWTMPADDRMLGTTSFNKQHVPGNGTLDDSTLQREQTSYWMARQLKIPWSYRRYYILYVNGNRHGPLMEDSQVPGSDLVSEYFPNDSNGFLYKNNAWFEFEPHTKTDQRLNFNNNSWCTLNRFNSRGIDGVTRPKLARYRWNYWMRQTPDSANNFTNVFALIDAANISAGAAYNAAMDSLVDTDEFMRMAALEHATGDWDSFTTQNQWNMYSYKPPAGRWTLLKWDWNITLGNSGSWGPDGGNLFTVSGSDPVMQRFQSYPPFKRSYLRALQEIADNAMNSTNIGPVLDAKYAAFRANGLPSGFGVTEPGANGLKQWIATMRKSILSALTSQGVANIPFLLTVPTLQIVGDSAITLTGSAPLEVNSFLVNGVVSNLRWSTTKNWSISVNLPRQTNVFTLTPVDHLGAAVGMDSFQIIVINTNAPSSDRLPLRINEWMAANSKTLINPASAATDDWFELFNPNSVTVDLSGYFLTQDPKTPTQFQFPLGSSVRGNGFLLVWADGGLTNSKDGTNQFVHAKFKLKKAGSLIALFDATTNLVDSITFGAQVADVSQGRYPDGAPLIYSLAIPTPAAGNSFTNSAPTLSPILDTNIALGLSLSVKAIASDSDAPPQSLSFSLALGNPSGMLIDPATGVLTWKLDSTTVPGAYEVTVRVSDNGFPPLNADRTFRVQVDPPDAPSIKVETPFLSNNQLSLRWSSSVGRKYQVQYLVNMASIIWVNVGSSIIATGEGSAFIDSIPVDEPQRFYRIIESP